MAGVQAEIKTRFTLGGIKEAAAGLRGFAQRMNASFEDVKKRTARVFETMKRSLDVVEAKVKAVGKTVATVGGKTAFHGIRLGALGASVAVGGLATKFAAVSAAALRTAKETAGALKSISIDAQRIGGSTEDVSVLGFAAEQTGTDRDELITQISTLSSEFLTLRENIAATDERYNQFVGRKRDDVRFAIDAAKSGLGVDALEGSLASVIPDIAQERLKSLSAVEDRIRHLDAEESSGRRRITASTPDNFVPDGDARLKRLNALAKRRAEQQEYWDLQDARKQLIGAMSPQGQAFYELRDFGLDEEKATRGGVQALLAVSDAFRRVQDESQKARIAAKLFGEDAGPKLIPLLNGGREAIEKYRDVLRESGAIATKADTDAADQYTMSIQRLRLAWEGVRLTVSRTLWPDMTKSADQLTAFLLRNREAIAAYVADVYKASEQLVQDVYAIFSGNTNSIQTKWLDTLVQKAISLKAVWEDVVRQFNLLSEGKDSDYGWINAIRDGFVFVRAVVIDVVKQISALAAGRDTDYPWLNKLRDGVVAFAEHFSKAFELVKSGLKIISELLDPILSKWGVDIMTLGMAVGMARMLGVFKLLTAAAGGLFGTLSKVFSLGGGAAAGAAGAAEAAGGAAAGAAATASGLAASLIRVGTVISTVIKGASVLGLSLVAGFQAGQKAAEYFYQNTQKAYDELFAAQAKLIAAQGDEASDKALTDRSGKWLEYQQSFWAQRNVQVHQVTPEQRAKAARETSNGWMGWDKDYDPSYGEGDAALADQYRAADKRYYEQNRPKAAAQKPTATIRYDININGAKATATGGPDVARALDQLNRNP